MKDAESYDGTPLLPKLCREGSAVSRISPSPLLHMGISDPPGWGTYSWFHGMETPAVREDSQQVNEGSLYKGTSFGLTAFRLWLALRPTGI